jgi:hypothetical protein
MLIKRKDHEYIENYHALADVLWQNNVLKKNVGAEIGVRSGITSQYLLAESPRLVMHLVDPYEPYLDCGVRYTQEMQDAIFEEAEIRVGRYGDRAIWHKNTSLNACNDFAEGSLDFVFIDANHDYNEVCVDLRIWVRKVRSGGLLCGHDYNMVGVKRAVDAMADKLGRPVVEVGWPAHVWFLEI